MYSSSFSVVGSTATYHTDPATFLVGLALAVLVIFLIVSPGR